MIPLSEINAASEKHQVTADTIEKDYVISWILFCLSKSKIKDNFIFYGGTAIKRIYFENHRFSEDIDLFSSKKFSLENILEELKILDKAREETNLELEINPKFIINRANRVQIFIKYSGFEEIIGVPKEIRLDFSMDINPYGKTITKKMIPSYSDLLKLDTTFCVMSLNTIFANKLGLLVDITRNEPRDIFDIWFLLQSNNKFDFNFKNICEVFKEKYGYKLNLSILKSSLSKRIMKENWEIRLRKQISTLPKFEQVVKDIQLQLEILLDET